jgi:hypothetical protein
MTVNVFLLLKVDGGIRRGWDISLRVINFLVAHFPKTKEFQMLNFTIQG